MTTHLVIRHVNNPRSPVQRYDTLTAHVCARPPERPPGLPVPVLGIRPTGTGLLILVLWYQGVLFVCGIKAPGVGVGA